jgi:hypothetical protein
MRKWVGNRTSKKERNKEAVVGGQFCNGGVGFTNGKYIQFFILR